jgi:hypothetical protein
MASVDAPQARRRVSVKNLGMYVSAHMNGM